MNWFRDRKKVTKLMLGFGVLAAMLCFVAYQGITTAQEINSSLATLHDRDLKGLSAWKEANIDLIYIGRAFRSAILTDDKAQVESYRIEIEKDKALLNANFDQAEKTIASEEARRTATETRAELSNFYSQVGEIMQLAAANQDKAAITQSQSVRFPANNSR